MTTHTISDIERALRRIETGWRIRHTDYDEWEVHLLGYPNWMVFQHAEEAKAEYLRLTAAPEKAA